MSRTLLVLLSAIFLTAVFLAACGSSSAGPTPTPAAAGSPAALLQDRCTACHSLQRVESAHKTQAGWEKTLRRMVGNGAQLSDAEFATLLAYLAETYK